MHKNIHLLEVTRMQMINAAKSLSPGRFARRIFYNTKSFKDVDFEKLFETDTFEWYAGVGDHVVMIEFDGAFEDLKWLVKGMRGPNRVNRLTLEMVSKALSKSLDTNDLRVGCSCPDFTYRYKYYAYEKGMSVDPHAGRYHYRPRFNKTNKDDSIGYVCKHILAVLFGKRWVRDAAKAWLSWMKANPQITEFYLWGKDLSSTDEEE